MDVRSTPRSKISLKNISQDKDNIKQPPVNNKAEKWNRFQELKRRREEMETKSNKKAQKPNNSIIIHEVKPKLSTPFLIKTDKASEPSAQDNPKPKKQRTKSTFDITDPSTLPKSIAKYMHMNEHLKGIDHGRLSAKDELENELDKAVDNGDLELASRLNDQLAQNKYETAVIKAIERKEFDETKKREEEKKANKKKPKLIWGTSEGTSLTYNVAAHERACFYVWADKPGEKVSFYFAVQSGGSFDIDYLVTDPRNKIVLNGERERQGDFVFTANFVGEYSFCFANDMSTFAEKLVDFEISIENEPRAELPPPKGIQPEHTSSMEESCLRLSSRLSAISRSQKYFRTRENRNFSTVKSTENRIFWFALLESMLIVGMAAVQVFVVKTFFNTTKRGHV
ncbi:7555_t:CDS:2 [Funneliformis geosporum]|uniref:7555_t:CDS:1 n=1 Tax=Funneliformis geosporum TaxID=1117311 RepID=A0A9W4SS37_9GLOM|nr:7555_t:CDS:2 [Funneliformis geosporum]